MEIKEPKISFSNSGFSLWWPEYGCWNFIIFQIRKSKMAYLKRTPFFSSPAKNKNLEKQMDHCIGVNTLSSLPTKMTITPMSSSPTISLLGLEYDSNFSTAPYLRELSREANTRAAVIRRLSFGMPNYLLKPFANGILMGKILAAAPAAIPIRMCMNEKPYLAGISKDIDKSIRSTARTITRTKLTDKVKSEIVLWKAGLRSLAEAVSTSMATTVWKSIKEMNPLGRIFENKLSVKCTRSTRSKNLCQPIPGHPEAAVNKLAQAWNAMNLSSAKTLGSAKSLAQKWNKTKS